MVSSQISRIRCGLAASLVDYLLGSWEQERDGDKIGPLSHVDMREIFTALSPCDVHV